MLESAPYDPLLGQLLERAHQVVRLHPGRFRRHSFSEHRLPAAPKPAHEPVFEKVKTTSVDTEEKCGICLNRYHGSQ